MTFVIWGGRRGDIWIGSAADRLYQQRAKMAVATRTLAVGLGNAILPSIKDLARAFEQIATVLPSATRAQRDRRTQ